MRFIMLVILSLLMQQAVAGNIILSCPSPQQLQVIRGNPNSVSATLQVLKGQVTPTQMLPVLTTSCNKITRNEFAAFYNGVLDCDYSCEYPGGTDELLFYSTNVEGMQPQLHYCKFKEGDAHECHYSEHNCVLICDS